MLKWPFQLTEIAAQGCGGRSFPVLSLLLWWGRAGGSRLSAGTGAGARQGTNDSAKAKGTKAAALPQIIPKLDHWQADNGEGGNKPRPAFLPWWKESLRFPCPRDFGCHM